MRVVLREFDNRVGNAFFGTVLVTVVSVHLPFKGVYVALSDQLSVLLIINYEWRAVQCHSVLSFKRIPRIVFHHRSTLLTNH